jgi:hypothetical protein
MQRIRVPITNFAFGEVSPSTLMRTDTPIYQASAQRIENMMMLSEGGVRRRPGLQRIYDFNITRDTDKKFQSKLAPFIFSGDEQYIVSIEHQQLRVFILDPTTGAVSLTATITQDVDTDALPFDDDFIHEYSWAQYGDVMVITHPLFLPRQLVRTSLTAFEVQKLSFDERNNGALTYQPYSIFHAADVTLAASGTTGTVTLTTSADYFDTTGLHDGVILRYHDTEVQISSVTNATTATGVVNGTLRQRLEILNPFRTIDGSSTVEVTHINHGFAGGETVIFEEASAVGGINSGNLNGSRTISGIIDENTYTFTAGGSASSAEDGGGYVKVVTAAPTTVWEEQSFSALRGYPAAVCFHENRLVFGGTIAQPDAIWMSKSGLFYNFDIGQAADDDSINIVGANSDVHEIRYLKSNRDLQVFTATAELYVPTYLNQAITPSNAQVRRQTPYGSMFVEPHSIDGATLFAQIGGRVVREYIYTDNEDAYSSTAVSTIASHLINNPKSLTVCHGAFDGAESYAAFPCDCGRITLFSSNRSERRAGWCKFTCQGQFYDAVAIDDRLFATAWIDTGAGEELILGEFNYDYTLDCSKLYTLTSGVADVSADFADGAVLSVVKDGEYFGTFTVASGEIDVSAYATTGQIEAGFSFTVNLTSNPIDAIIANGPQTGEIRGVSTVVLDLVDTRSVQVNSRPVTITGAYTGKKEVRLLGYGRDPQVVITQSSPLPLQVNGFVAEVVV